MTENHWAHSPSISIYYKIHGTWRFDRKNLEPKQTSNSIEKNCQIFFDIRILYLFQVVPIKSILGSPNLNFVHISNCKSAVLVPQKQAKSIPTAMHSRNLLILLWTPEWFQIFWKLRKWTKKNNFCKQHRGSTGKVFFCMGNKAFCVVRWVHASMSPCPGGRLSVVM